MIDQLKIVNNILLSFHKEVNDRYFVMHTTLIHFCMDMRNPPDWRRSDTSVIMASEMNNKYRCAHIRIFLAVSERKMEWILSIRGGSINFRTGWEWRREKKNSAAGDMRGAHQSEGRGREDQYQINPNNFLSIKTPNKQTKQNKKPPKTTYLFLHIFQFSFIPFLI